MHSLAARLQNTVGEFIAQTEARWLLIAVAENDAPIVFRLLLSCERQSRSDVYLLLGTPFVSAAQYADAVVEQYVAEYRALATALAAQHQAPRAGLPEQLLDRTIPPAQRLAQVLQAAAELLPASGDHRLVCGFWPLEVADPVAYEQLLAALLPHSSGSGLDSAAPVPPQWKQNLRLIGRTGRDGPAATAAAWGAQPVVRAKGDFSPAALYRDLQQTVDDAAQPAAVRMPALLMLATHGSGSGSAAIAQYRQVLAYYQEQNDPAMQTVVLLQLGEAYHRQQQLTEARDCYERALTPAAAAPVPVCTVLLAKNLGDVAFLQQRYADAATCYRTWHRLAGKLGDTAGQRAARKLLALAQHHAKAAR